MDIQGPKLFERIDTWIENNNLITPPWWKIYRKAIMRKTAAFLLIYFIAGVAFGYLFIPR